MPRLHLAILADIVWLSWSARLRVRANLSQCRLIRFRTIEQLISKLTALCADAELNANCRLQLSIPGGLHKVESYSCSDFIVD